MKWLTLDKIKQQLRIEPDFTMEDSLLTSYGEAAEETLLNYLNRQYQDVIDTWGQVPLPLVQASLMLVDVSYQYRSPISVTNISVVPYTFDILVKPYMRLASVEDNGDVQTVTLGSDVKIAFTAELPDGLLLKDIEFTGKVINADEKDKVLAFTKAECIMLEGGSDYMVLVDTETLGIGTYMLRLTVQIPDTDYTIGYRKEVIKINPQVKCEG
jgi:hypothetical protein